MSVFATNYFETMTDDVDGGKDWSWNPMDANKQTGPGKPTNSHITTKNGADSNDDKDQPVESKGMLVA